MNLNKIYIIAGSSSGIGLECAKKISKKNDVIGLFNSTKQKNAKNLMFYKLDLEKKSEIEKFFFKKKTLLNKYKKIIFINFATFKKDNLLINIKSREIQKTFKINLFSNFYFSLHLLKNHRLKKLEIIFISSSLGIKVDAGTSLYSSTKYSLESLMKSIVIEYSNFNVKCNLLILGFFKTTLWDKLTNEKKDKITNLLPAKKIGKTSDILKAINFIEASNSINASSIYLDSGFGKVRV
jgi:3-oxoacyl-[acyl-carrier protein] reductase